MRERERAREQGPDQAVCRIRQHGNGKVLLRHDAGPRDVAKQAAGMTEPVPVFKCAAAGPEAVGRR
jgi:hypothetical protein